MQFWIEYSASRVHLKFGEYGENTKKLNPNGEWVGNVKQKHTSWIDLLKKTILNVIHSISTENIVVKKNVPEVYMYILSKMDTLSVETTHSNRFASLLKMDLL